MSKHKEEVVLLTPEAIAERDGERIIAHMKKTCDARRDKEMREAEQEKQKRWWKKALLRRRDSCRMTENNAWTEIAMRLADALIHVGEILFAISLAELFFHGFH